MSIRIGRIWRFVAAPKKKRADTLVRPYIHSLTSRSAERQFASSPSQVLNLAEILSRDE